MHRTKKILVTATAAALLMATGMSSAMATRTGGDDDNEHNDHEKVTMCHRTGPKDDPRWHEITVSENAVPAHQRHGDFIVDANHPCPPRGDDGDDGDDDGDHDGDHDGGDCSASSSSGDSTQSQDGLINVGNINLGLNNLLANTGCHSSILNNVTAAVLGHATGGFVGGSGDGDCAADSTSGDSEQEQEGLVNVGNINLGLNNAAANTLCGASLLNNVTAAVLGHATGGVVDSDSDDGDCIADSTSGDSDQDQGFGVNVGNINAGANNLLANLACGSSILNNPTVAVLGSALGGSSLGTGILSGDALSILGGTSGLLAGLSTDVEVLANVLLYL